MLRSRTLPVLFSIIPVASVVFLVLKLAVEVPYFDEWEMIPLLQKSYEGHLQLTDFWAQHSEHRPFVSRIVLLLLARLTHWNMRFEFAGNLVLAGTIAAMIGRQVVVTSRQLRSAGLCWVIPAVSLTVFSIGAHENWLWGWQIALFLNLLTAVASLLLLANAPLTWPRIGCSAGLAILATYSLANGMLVWPIGLALLLCAPSEHRNKKLMIVTWALVAGLTVTSYFIGYYKPTWHPPINAALKMPLEYACYLLKYVGGICAEYDLVPDDTDGFIALISGVVAVAATAWSTWIVVRRKIVPLKGLLPYGAMSAYSLGTAFLSGIGRVGFGSNEALSSRYCTLIAPFWASLITVLAIILTNDQKAINAIKTLAQWILALSVSLLFIGSALAIGPAKARSWMLADARAQLLALARNPESVQAESLLSLYPRPEVVIERYPVLVKYHLSVFRTR